MFLTSQKTSGAHALDSDNFGVRQKDFKSLWNSDKDFLVRPKDFSGFRQGFLKCPQGFFRIPTTFGRIFLDRAQGFLRIPTGIFLPTLRILRDSDKDFSVVLEDFPGFRQGFLNCLQGFFRIPTRISQRPSRFFRDSDKDFFFENPTRNSSRQGFYAQEYQSKEQWPLWFAFQHSLFVNSHSQVPQLRYLQFAEASYHVALQPLDVVQKYMTPGG